MFVSTIVSEFSLKTSFVQQDVVSGCLLFPHTGEWSTILQLIKVQNSSLMIANYCDQSINRAFNKKLSYRRETARQLRIHAQLTRCFSAVAV